MFLRVQFSLPAEVVPGSDGPWWVASCPVLDVTSQGPTRDEALANLSDALGCFVESCVRRGTIFEVLRQSGFEPNAVIAPPTSERDDLQLDVQVPLAFMCPPTGERRPGHDA
jgi:predicted RNase H-like HicB family nuclease